MRVLIAIAVVILSVGPALTLECLSSADAVRKEHPGMWPSWSEQLPGHKNQKCYFGMVKGGKRAAQVQHKPSAAPVRSEVKKPKEAPPVRVEKEDLTLVFGGILVNHNHVVSALVGSSVFDEALAIVYSGKFMDDVPTIDRFAMELAIGVLR